MTLELSPDFFYIYTAHDRTNSIINKMRDYKNKNIWKVVIIGLTQKSTEKDLTEYYNEYNLEIDPQLILVDRDQNVIFNERYGESSAKILKELTIHLSKINKE